VSPGGGNPDLRHVNCPRSRCTRPRAASRRIGTRWQLGARLSVLASALRFPRAEVLKRIVMERGHSPLMLL